MEIFLYTQFLKMKKTGILLVIFFTSFACGTPKEGMKEINGTQLYYKIIGRGEPVIILHGGPGLDHSYFLPQMGKLAENYQLVFYDQRACGKSSVQVDENSMRMEFFLKDLDEIRRHFGAEKVHIIGHSWGGLLAMQYAINYPDRVKSLSLISSIGANKEFASHSSKNLKNRTSREDSIQRAEIIQSGELQNGEIKEYEKLYRLIFKKSFYNPLLSDSLSLDFNRNFVKTQRLIAFLGKDLAGYDLYSDLKEKIYFPTLILHGDYDIIPVEVAQKIHKHIPHSELVILKNCGHFPYIEQPEIFFDTLVSFLRKADGQIQSSTDKMQH